MIRIQIKIPQVRTAPEKEILSPCCRSGTHIHEHRYRKLQDTKIDTIHTIRRKCKACGKTFTQRPEGVSQSPTSDRIRAFSVMLWVLGLSLDGVASALGGLDITAGRITIWDWIQKAGEQAHKLRKSVAATVVEVGGVDSTIMKVKGKSLITSFLTNALNGQTLDVAFMSSEDTEALVRRLERFAKELGMKLIISDDADAYKGVTEKLGIEHQICQAHVKKNLMKRLRDIERQVRQTRDRKRIRTVRKDIISLRNHAKNLTVRILRRGKWLYEDYLKAPPPRPTERASPEYRLRMLGLDITENGPQLFTFRTWNRLHPNQQLDGTNNVTERAIGLTGKIRYRSTRGFKSRKGLRRYLDLLIWMRNHQHAFGKDVPLEVGQLVS